MGVVEHLGLYAGSFGLALARVALPSIQVVILGEGSKAAELGTIALTGYAVNKTVIRLRRSQLQSLPGALAGTLPHLPDADGAVALVCVGQTCHPPVTDASALIALLQQANAR